MIHRGFDALSCNTRGSLVTVDRTLAAASSDIAITIG